MQKKYKVASLYTPLYILFFLFFVSLLLFCWYAYEGEKTDRIIILLTIIWLIGIGCSLWSLFFDKLCGKFSVDESGITMYTAFKRWYYPWDTLNYCGTTWTKTANDGGMYCIYFSKRELTEKEINKFLSSTRFDHNNIAYFQYSEETMAEIYPLLPPEIAAKVKENVELVESSMNKFERRHHK